MEEEVINIFDYSEIKEGFFDIEANKPIKKFEIGNGFEQEIYKQGDVERIIIRRTESCDGEKLPDDSGEPAGHTEDGRETLENLLESKCADYDRDYRGIRIDNSVMDMKYENGIIILNEQLLKEGSRAIANRITQLFKEV